MRLTPTARRLAAGLTVGAMFLIPPIASPQAASVEITVEPAGPNCDGVTATGPEWDAYQAALAAQADAKAQYELGSLGFFRKMGATDAVTALTTGAHVSDTHVGQSGDATDLKLMLESLKWIPVADSLRANDPARTDPGIAALRGVPQAGASMAPLVVTDRLMAIAQYSANYQVANGSLNHVVGHLAGENLAYNGVWPGPNTKMRYSAQNNIGPYDGWWYKEKEVWDTQTAGMTQAQREAWLADETPHIYTLSSGEQTRSKTNFGHVGHYLTLADANSGARMTHTGFAIAEPPSPDGNGFYKAYASQTFSAKNMAGSAWGPKPNEQTFTVPEYITRLKAYVDQIDPNIHKQKVDEKCQALLDSLEPTPSPSPSVSPSASLTPSVSPSPSTPPSPSATPTTSAPVVTPSAPATMQPTAPVTPSPTAEPTTAPTMTPSTQPTDPVTPPATPSMTSAPVVTPSAPVTPGTQPGTDPTTEPNVPASAAPTVAPIPSATGTAAGAEATAPAATGQPGTTTKTQTSANPPTATKPKPKKSGLARTGAGAQVLLPLAGGMVLAGAVVRRRRQA